MSHRLVLRIFETRSLGFSDWLIDWDDAHFFKDKMADFCLNLDSDSSWIEWISEIPVTFRPFPEQNWSYEMVWPIKHSWGHEAQKVSQKVCVAILGLTSWSAKTHESLENLTEFVLAQNFTKIFVTAFDSDSDCRWISQIFQQIWVSGLFWFDLTATLSYRVVAEIDFSIILGFWGTVGVFGRRFWVSTYLKVSLRLI